MLNSLFMVADPFSKKYMILSYSFGDHSSHQSSTHPRLRSKSAAKFVCRQELASTAPASAVAAAVQPASASLPPLTLTPPSPCYFWAKRQRSTCKKELSSICFVNSTPRATKAVIADWVALEDEILSEEEEEEEEEDGVGGGVACMQMRALDATAQTRCSDCVWTLGAEHSELSLSGATLSCLSCLSSNGWKKNMAAAPIPRSGIPPFRNLEKELC